MKYIALWIYIYGVCIIGYINAQIIALPVASNCYIDSAVGVKICEPISESTPATEPEIQPLDDYSPTNEPISISDSPTSIPITVAIPDAIPLESPQILTPVGTVPTAVTDIVVPPSATVTVNSLEPTTLENITVSASGTLIFSSPSLAQLQPVIINDTADIAGTLVLQLSRSDWSQVSNGATVTLLVVVGNGTLDLSDSASIELWKSGSNNSANGLTLSTPYCKRLSAQLRVTTQETGARALEVLFGTDTFNCQIWWIILICGIAFLVLVVAITVVAVFKVPWLREHVLPFAQRTHRDDTSTAIPANSTNNYELSELSSTTAPSSMHSH